MLFNRWIQKLTLALLISVVPLVAVQAASENTAKTHNGSQIFDQIDPEKLVTSVCGVLDFPEIPMVPGLVRAPIWSHVSDVGYEISQSGALTHNIALNSNDIAMREMARTMKMNRQIDGIGHVTINQGSIAVNGVVQNIELTKVLAECVRRLKQSL